VNLDSHGKRAALAAFGARLRLAARRLRRLAARPVLAQAGSLL
jgi:hypothetical protein